MFQTTNQISDQIGKFQISPADPLENHRESDSQMLYGAGIVTQTFTLKMTEVRSNIPYMNTWSIWDSCPHRNLIETSFRVTRTMKIQRIACCSLELEARKYLACWGHGYHEMVNLQRETDNLSIQFNSLN